MLSFKLIGCQQGLDFVRIVLQPVGIDNFFKQNCLIVLPRSPKVGAAALFIVPDVMAEITNRSWRLTINTLEENPNATRDKIYNKL